MMADWIRARPVRRSEESTDAVDYERVSLHHVAEPCSGCLDSIAYARKQGEVYSPAFHFANSFFSASVGFGPTWSEGMTLPWRVR